MEWWARSYVKASEIIENQMVAPKLKMVNFNYRKKKLLEVMKNKPIGSNAFPLI